MIWQDIARRLVIFISVFAATSTSSLAAEPIDKPASGPTIGTISWDSLHQGEYVGPPRTPHVPEYRLRVDDELEFTFAAARDAAGVYRLQVGDEIKIQSAVDVAANREVTIQPDGTIDLYLVGPLLAAGLAIDELKKAIDESYKKFYKVSDFSLQRLRTSKRLDDLRSGGQARRVRVAPDGTVALPEIGNVFVQGLSLEEVRREVNERYAEAAPGLSVTPALAARAPRYIFVVGAVERPGRFLLESPTTVLGGLSLAGGWSHSASLRQVTILRRDDDWQLVATTLDLRGVNSGRGPCPASEIVLRDCDVILVPKVTLHGKHDWWGTLLSRGICQPTAVACDSEL